MRGRVECTFAGGPAGDEKLFMPPMQCHDRLSLEQEGWLRCRADGALDVMTGMRPQNADWECYSIAVYNKVPRAEAAGVLYQFDEIKTVMRCKGTAASTKNRCKHAAIGEGEYCRQHSLPALTER